MTYHDTITQMRDIVAANGPSWAAIDPESAARMAIQNRFATGLDIAKHTAGIMRADMAAYDANPAQYTQSLGCWHGFIAQQKLIAIKKHFGTTKQRYLYLSGWMVAALRSEFGPLPDQSMHEKTSVPALIAELYTFLKQADARELGGMFRALDAARAAGDAVEAKRLEDLLQRSSRQIELAPDNTTLLTEEARLTKALFKLAVDTVGYGDFTRAKRGSGSDPANRFLDHGNYLAYGLGATATWVLGLPHGLAVLHGKTRRGGLVFDVADLVKDASILPQAFISAMRGDDEQTFRRDCIEALSRSESLDFMIETLKTVAISVAGKAA